MIAHGHRFRTESDTEVIVHGYEEWGELCVEKFRGMFAFAIWDALARRLVLARDRVGVKPLYYAELPATGVVFGSELKSLLEDPDVPRDGSPRRSTRTCRCCTCRARDTIDEGVTNCRRRMSWWPRTTDFPPALLGFDIHRDLDVGRTRRLDAKRSTWMRSTPHSARPLRLRLISDVPLGAFLSGGIDSTAVVAYMVETSRHEVVTTTVGFDRGRVRRVPACRTVWPAIWAAPIQPADGAAEIEDLLPRLAWHFDEPFGDASPFRPIMSPRLRDELVTVALSGDGADELWAGYGRHGFSGRNRGFDARSGRGPRWPAWWRARCRSPSTGVRSLTAPVADRRRARTRTSTHAICSSRTPKIDYTAGLRGARRD